MFVKQVFVPLKINSQAMVWKKKVYLYIYHNIYIYIYSVFWIISKYYKYKNTISISLIELPEWLITLYL